MDNKTKAIQLNELGYTRKEIADELNIRIDLVAYYLGENNSIRSPKPFIDNINKRIEVIKSLQETKGKNYEDILYLNYLKGDIDKKIYLSAF